jgi:hypothetical protein
LLLGSRASAQDAAPPAPIQDNSFLLEEAYNQDPGVVQHISTFTRSLRDPGEWAASFTQEWPAPGLRHQLSYSIPLLGGAGDGTGVGDIALNYRYQLAGNADSRFAVAPRATVLLPTGSERNGRGSGALGWNAAMAFSAVASRRLMLHTNAGVIVTPHAHDGLGNQADLSALTLGQSAVFLMKPLLNLMLEAVWTRSGSVAGPGMQVKENAFVLSPGVRWGYNLKNGLQVVPGVALPFGLGPSHGDRALLLYLSFEHPFRHSRP